MELLTNGEARAIELGLRLDLLGFMYMPLRSQADPVKATQSFPDAAATKGANILTGNEVTSIGQQVDGTYRVVTNQG